MFTNMTYNNCGSSTVQPKVHKVCFSGEKTRKKEIKILIIHYAPILAVEFTSACIQLEL